jgi:hypothetical protein
VTGEVIDSLDATMNGPFEGAIELTERLATSARVQSCVSLHFYRFAMGRVEEEADRCSVGQASAAFIESGGNFRELLVALTLTDAFRFRQPFEAAP